MPWPLMFSIAGTVNGIGCEPSPGRDRERHRREHVGGVVFLVDGLVADDRPAGGLDHLDVEPVLGVEAHRMRHDDRRGAGDRDEADLQLLLFQRAGALRERFRSPSSAGRTARARRARSRRRPDLGTRGARRPSGTSRASPPTRRHPRSASRRSSGGRAVHCATRRRQSCAPWSGVAAAGAARPQAALGGSNGVSNMPMSCRLFRCRGRQARGPAVPAPALA